MEQYADEINCEECLNCDITSGSAISKKLSIDNTGDDIVDILESKEQEYGNVNSNLNENLYFDYMMREPNTEEAFSDKNINVFNFEDYFSV